MGGIIGYVVNGPENTEIILLEIYFHGRRFSD